jgi:hypothetical protein
VPRQHEIIGKCERGRVETRERLEDYGGHGSWKKGDRQSKAVLEREEEGWNKREKSVRHQSSQGILLFHDDWASKFSPDFPRRQRSGFVAFATTRVHASWAFPSGTVWKHTDF